MEEQRRKFSCLPSRTRSQISSVWIKASPGAVLSVRCCSQARSHCSLCTCCPTILITWISPPQVWCGHVRSLPSAKGRKMAARRRRHSSYVLSCKIDNVNRLGWDVRRHEAQVHEFKFAFLRYVTTTTNWAPHALVAEKRGTGKARRMLDITCSICFSGRQTK